MAVDAREVLKVESKGQTLFGAAATQTSRGLVSSQPVALIYIRVKNVLLLPGLC